MIALRALAVLIAATLSAVVSVASASGDRAPLFGFASAGSDPSGGAVFEGRIPNHFVADRRLADVYLPPGFSTAKRYPVIYFLHGFWGSPSSFVHGMQLPTVADGLIRSGIVPPFIAVMPPGGPLRRSESANGEWAGVWEDYLVHDVIPWVDAHLPTLPGERVLAGLSAGGFGAVDIGLRHPTLFTTLESWGGYFRPFRDGPFTHASSQALAAHDPTILVRREANRLRAAGMRFFLSTGRSGHGSVKAKWTFEFANELKALHLPVNLWVLPAGQTGHLWRAQLPDAITYAFAAA